MLLGLNGLLLRLRLIGGRLWLIRGKLWLIGGWLWLIGRWLWLIDWRLRLIHGLWLRWIKCEIRLNKVCWYKRLVMMGIVMVLMMSVMISESFS